MTGPEPLRSAPEKEEPPPLLGTWRRLYGAVLLTLVLLITLFYFFGRAFR